MLVVGVDEEILSLSADSLQSMADAMKFEKVHNNSILSLVFSKDGKYYYLLLVVCLCINYNLNVII